MRSTLFMNGVVGVLGATFCGPPWVHSDGAAINGNTPGCFTVPESWCSSGVQVRACHSVTSSQGHGSIMFRDRGGQIYGSPVRVAVFSDDQCTEDNLMYLAYFTTDNWAVSGRSSLITPASSVGPDFSTATSTSNYFFGCGFSDAEGPVQLTSPQCWENGFVNQDGQASGQSQLPCIPQATLTWGRGTCTGGYSSGSNTITVPSVMCHEEQLDTSLCYSGASFNGAARFFFFAMNQWGNAELYLAPSGCNDGYEYALTLTLSNLHTIRNYGGEFSNCVGDAGGALMTGNGFNAAAVIVQSSGCGQQIENCPTCLARSFQEKLEECDSNARGAAKEVIESYLTGVGAGALATLTLALGSDPVSAALGAVTETTPELTGQAREVAQAQCSECLGHLIAVIKDYESCTDNCGFLEGLALSTFGGALEDAIDTDAQCCAAFNCPCTTLPEVSAGEGPGTETCGPGVDEVSPGGSCSPACASAYEPSVGSIQCNAGGTFSSTSFSCSAIPCTNLPTVSSGNGPDYDATCGPNVAQVVPGGSCQLACAYGYEPSQSSTQCQIGGTFSLHAFSCNEIVCSSLPANQDGSASAEPCGPDVVEVVAGQDCLPSCPEGFEASPAAIRCQVSGEFEASSFSCNEIPCRDLPTVSSGNGPDSVATCGPGVMEVASGDSCQLACAYGSEPSQASMQCQSGGMFETTEFSCNEVVCASLPENSDGSASAEPCGPNVVEVVQGQDCSPFCPDGFEASPAAIRCQVSGEFEATTFSCNEITTTETVQEIESGTPADDAEVVAGGSDEAAADGADDAEVASAGGSDAGADDAEVASAGGSDAGAEASSSYVAQFLVSGNLQLTVDAATATEFTTDPAVNAVLRQSIASSLSGVDPASVEILSVTLSRRLGSKQAGLAQGAPRQLQTSSVTVDYQVAFPTSEHAEDAAEELAAVNPSTFTTTMLEELEAAGLDYEVTIDSVEAQVAQPEENGAVDGTVGPDAGNEGDLSSVAWSTICSRLVIVSSILTSVLWNA